MINKQNNNNTQISEKMDFSVCKYMALVHLAFRYVRVSTTFVSVLFFVAKILTFCPSVGDVGTRPEIRYLTRVNKYLCIPRPIYWFPFDVSLMVMFNLHVHPEEWSMDNNIVSKI